MHETCRGPLEHQCGDCLYETAKALLEALQAICDDATGDIDDPTKRVWPIRAKYHRQARAAIAKAGKE